MIKYISLSLNEMKYGWQGGSGVLFKDAKFKLPEHVSETGSKPNYYYGKDGYYWTFQLIQLQQVQHQWYMLDIIKIKKLRLSNYILIN